MLRRRRGCDNDHDGFAGIDVTTLTGDDDVALFHPTPCRKPAKATLSHRPARGDNASGAPGSWLGTNVEDRTALATFGKTPERRVDDVASVLWVEMPRRSRSEKCLRGHRDYASIKLPLSWSRSLHLRCSPSSPNLASCSARH
jgi:hypothetical protein